MVEKAKSRIPGLEVREWDLLEHPELAVRYGVMAAPAIVINDRLVFRTVPKERALLERLEALAARPGE